MDHIVTPNNNGGPSQNQQHGQQLNNPLITRAAVNSTMDSSHSSSYHWILAFLLCGQNHVLCNPLKNVVPVHTKYCTCEPYNFELLCQRGQFISGAVTFYYKDDVLNIFCPSIYLTEFNKILEATFQYKIAHFQL